MTKVASTKPEEKRVDTIKLTLNGRNVYGRVTPAKGKGVLANVGGEK